MSQKGEALPSAVPVDITHLYPPKEVELIISLFAICYF